jgi:hypothetical protein
MTDTALRFRYPLNLPTVLNRTQSLRAGHRGMIGRLAFNQAIVPLAFVLIRNIAPTTAKQTAIAQRVDVKGTSALEYALTNCLTEKGVTKMMIALVTVAICGNGLVGSLGVGSAITKISVSIEKCVDGSSCGNVSKRARNVILDSSILINNSFTLCIDYLSIVYLINLHALTR